MKPVRVSKMINKILIVGHSNIGDACYDLVVVDPLRGKFPEARISFLTSSRAGNIAEGYRGLDEVIAVDRHLGGPGAMGHLRVMWRLARKRFDLAVVLKETVMPYVLGIPRVWKAKKSSGAGAMRHPADRNLEFLRERGVEAQRAVFGFAFGRGEEEFRDSFFARHGLEVGTRLVGIFPMAAWSVKNWPVSKWNELAGILGRKYGIKVVCFGKRNGDPYNKTVLKNLSGEIIFADTPTLKHAMILIRCCDLFIGPDSSLIHLASCMGGNIIALYGPTSSEYIYPYFHKDSIITAARKPDCMPCYPGHDFCPCNAKYRTTVCMENISLEEVLPAVESKLRLHK